MSRNKLGQNAVDTTTKIVEDLKAGDRVESNHPYYAGAAVVDSLPSTDGAVVQLASGARQYIPRKYLRASTENPGEPAVGSSSERLETISLEAISPKTITSDVVEPLTPDEERERHRLELRVERAFFEAGKALTQLRDQKLYRSTHKTFEAYCQARFGFSRRHPYRLMEAATVVDNLEAFCVQFGHILPAKESVCRPLVELKPDEQKTAWQQIMQTTGGKQPTAQTVKSAVEQIKSKPLFTAASLCQIGDVFTLTRLEGCDRRYNGYPCVAIELKQFTICVDVHDTILSVKPENLQKLDSPEAHRQLPQILMRIKRLRQVGTLDRGANHFLAGVGRQVYLTEVEEMLLSCLEAHYKVEDC